MKIADHCVVSILYVLTNAEGEQLDASSGEPLHYLHGHKNIVPGLEEALTGRDVGDEFEVAIPPEQAYGLRSEELVQDVPRAAFQGVETIEPGMQFQAQTPQGAQLITVQSVDGDTIKIDGNHPLAGVALHFKVQVVDVREATAEEKAQGHFTPGSSSS
ncbi:MAG: peptidylprolyl isomerase [Acidobacteriota bacterium]